MRTDILVKFCKLVFRRDSIRVNAIRFMRDDIHVFELIALQDIRQQVLLQRTFEEHKVLGADILQGVRCVVGE
ncbi:hypothetical protein SDC9_76257 [bioreactor metagenome]|uniref:Uncharacterized protein n=1 Tax=bioreactor metagenome TaxID=1076179 RepID=A0A644YN58_9ZZZZ